MRGKFVREAVLVFVTTVRVNPSGVPYRLGLAIARSGRTRLLCRVEGEVRESGRDRVWLEECHGIVVARPLRGR